MKAAKEFRPVNVVIIDCFYVAYRGHCALLPKPGQQRPLLQTKDGMPTTAIHGFLMAVQKMAKDLSPESIIVATEGSFNDRQKIYPEYKAGRALPPEFKVQIPFIHKLIGLLGWHLVEKDGYEADDMVAAIIKHVKENQMRCAVFTSDKDICALCDEHIGIWKTEKGRGYILGPDDYMAKWGVLPAQKPEVLSLTGDSVDNIPGIKGLGEKTAVRLIREFGTVENVLLNLNRLPLRTRKLLEGNQELVRLSKQLIQLRTDAPISEAVFQPGQQRTDALLQFYLDLNMVKTAHSLEKPPQAEAGADAAVMDGSNNDPLAG